MRINRWAARVLAGSLCACACAATKVPPGWLDKPEQLQTRAYGSWIETRCARDPGEPVSVSGELIAITADSVYIARDRVVAVARVSIEEARLVAYDASSGGMVAFTIAGTLSTLSHGWALVFSAPVWIIGGSIAMGTRAMEPVRTYPRSSLDSFAPYARFPFGMPKAIDRTAIRIKVP